MRTLRAPVFSLPIVCFFGGLALGQGRSIPQPSALVWTEAAAPRLHLKVFPTDDNGFYVVWNSSSSTHGFSVFGQRFDNDGGVSNAAPSLWTDPVDQPESWDACPDQKFGFYLASVEAGRARLQHIDARGERAWQQILSASDGGTTPISEAVAAEDGQGGIVLAWVEQFGNGPLLWVQRWNAEGQAQWPGRGIRASPLKSGQINPSMIKDGQGGMLLAWKSVFAENAAMHAQRISADGRLLWDPQGVDVHAVVGDLRKHLVMGAPGLGGLVVAWSAGVSGKNRTFFQHVGPAGVRTWRVDGITLGLPIDEQWNPVLLGNGVGGLWIGWEEVPDNGPQKIVLVRRDAPDGKAWPAGEIKISAAPGSQGRLGMESDGSGGVLAAWMDNRTDTGIYLQDITAEGVLRYGTGLLVANGLNHPQQPHLLLLANRRAAVVWADDLGKNRWYLKRRVIDASK